MKKIIIIDAQTIQTLPIAKALKKRGFYVISLCDSKNSYGYYTKYADERIITPSTENNVEEFHQFFIKYLSKNRIDLIIPMNDYSAYYCSLHKKELLNHTALISPNIDVFLKGYDKNQLMGICEAYNYPHPKTADLSSMSIEEAIKKIGFPAIIKPNKTTGARGFKIVENKASLIEFHKLIQKDYGDCHLQEYIPSGGAQYKVELFVYKKELINSTVIHKIRFYPQKGGSSCFNQTIEQEDLVQLCYNVLKTIGWEGFADFDLIEDPRTGVRKIMEINPRIPASIKASFNAGVDFAENIASATLGNQPQRYKYNPGSYLRYFSLDLLWLLSSKERFQIKPAWWYKLFSSDHFLQDGSWDDPKPFIYGTIGGFLKQLNPKFREAKKSMN